MLDASSGWRTGEDVVGWCSMNWEGRKVGKRQVSAFGWGAVGVDVEMVNAREV